jgi:hypothetical protein
MTDLERMKQLFTDMGLPFSVAACDPFVFAIEGHGFDETMTLIHIETDNNVICGYDCFYSDFAFDSNGKFFKASIAE